MDLGILVVRLVFGLLMAAHGAQKLFGWFGGYGLNGTGGYMESIGFRPGRVFAALAGATEFVGGLLVAFGLFGPVGPALFLPVMIVAALAVHWKGGLFAMTNGIEVPLLYATAGLALALIGSGAFSVDALLGLTFAPAFRWIVIAAAVIGGFANLALRRPAPVFQEVKKAA